MFVSGSFDSIMLDVDSQIRKQRENDDDNGVRNEQKIRLPQSEKTSSMVAVRCIHQRSKIDRSKTKK